MYYCWFEHVCVYKIACYNLFTVAVSMLLEAMPIDLSKHVDEILKNA